MDKIVYIMRGVPGSGKSTYIKNNIPNAAVFSTDDRFKDYDKEWAHMNKIGDYSPLGHYHAENLRLAKKAMESGRSHIVIDNTNLEPWEPKSYVEAALANGYEVEIINIPPNGTAEELASRNIHGVPADGIRRMLGKLAVYPELTVNDILTAERR